MVHIESNKADVSETNLRKQLPEVLAILLIDRSRSKGKDNIRNIVWANDNYLDHGERYYAPACEILPDLITGANEGIIVPRAMKTAARQKERTKTNAEVFTPTWIVKKQNDVLDENFKDDSLEQYIGRIWLEITCGEAPYITSRYEMEDGSPIPLEQRVGFLDRKLQKINEQVDDYEQWKELVAKAYKACYGFEWNGDSLLLARENLLYTMQDYHQAKWHKDPEAEFFIEIATIISYNIFQMDGIKYVVPYSEAPEVEISYNFADLLAVENPNELNTKSLKQPPKGVDAKIRDWSKKREHLIAFREVLTHAK